MGLQMVPTENPLMSLVFHGKTNTNYTHQHASIFPCITSFFPDFLHAEIRKEEHGRREGMEIM